MIITVCEVYSQVLPLFCLFCVLTMKDLKRVIRYVYVYINVYMGSVSHDHRDGPNVCIGGEDYIAQP